MVAMATKNSAAADAAIDAVGAHAARRLANAVTTKTEMTFSERNKLRCESPSGFNHALESWSPSDWAVAFIGEAGEACNIIKKLNRIRDGIPGNAIHETEGVLLKALRKELADASIYLDLLAQRYGLDLEECRNEKFAETSLKIGYVERAGE